MATTTSISLRALARQEPPGARRGRVCAVAAVTSELPAPERAALNQLLANPGWPAGALADSVSQAGYPSLTRSVIERHRQGRCSCTPLGGSA